MLKLTFTDGKKRTISTTNASFDALGVRFTNKTLGVAECVTFDRLAKVEYEVVVSAAMKETSKGLQLKNSDERPRRNTLEHLG